MEKGQLLTPDEARKFELDEKGMYLLYGLFDDKPNHSADPISFTIAKDAVKKIADTAIGRPILRVPQEIKKHLTGPVRKMDEIIEYQKPYAIGEFVADFVTPSNNAYGIVSIWPEYQELVRTGQLKPYGSTLLQNDKMEDGILHEGRMIHFQLLNDDNPGYSKELVTVHGVCEGGLTECVNELKVLGSAGKLREYQKQFFNARHSNGSVIMTPLEEQVAELAKKQEASDKLLGSFGEQVTQILDKVNTLTPPAKEEPKPEPTTAPAKDEALYAELEKMKLKIKEQDDLIAAAKKKADDDARTEVVNSILKSEQRLGEFTSKDKDSRFKYWFELKDDAGNLMPLKIVADKLKTAASKIVGSAGEELYDDINFTPVGSSGRELPTDELIFERFMEKRS